MSTVVLPVLHVRVTFPCVRLFSSQDDLAIMIEGTDGQYYLQAGAILIPGLSPLSYARSLRLSGFLL